MSAKKAKAKTESFDSKKIRSKSRIILKLVAVLVALVWTITTVPIFARYVYESINNFFVRSEEYYFNSDKLSVAGSVYQIENWSGVENYPITVNMNSRLNGIKRVNYDIGYTIDYTNSTNCTCTLSKSSGTIPGSTNSDTFVLTIIPAPGLNVGDSVWVKINVKSAASTGYKQTLKGTFTLIVGKETLTYEITDSRGSVYCDLNLTNTVSYYFAGSDFLTYHTGDRIDVDTYLSLSESNKARCYSAEVTVTFDPTVLRLDMTNQNYINAKSVSTMTINGTTYINGMTFDIEPIQSAVVRFYKLSVNQNYTYPGVAGTPIVTVTSR